MLGLNIEAWSSLISILVAIVSAVSWGVERRKRTSERRERQRQLWSNLSKVKGLMADLEKLPADDGLDFGRHQAVGKLTFMFRDLAHEVLSLEADPTEKTIRAWRHVGKIGSDWQEQCFLNLLLSEEITAKDSSFSASDADELPANHPMSAAHSAKNK